MTPFPVGPASGPTPPDLPARAEVVVVGGGIVGCSVAYHLTRAGVRDVLLLEQGRLTSGSTWHAAGLVSLLKATPTPTRLATYSAELYQALEAETGQATGYRAPGSISVAADAERWEELRRGASLGRSLGIDVRTVEPDEAGELCPLLRTDDLVGALHLPDDGVTSPVDTTMALSKGARARGARIVEGVAVTDLLVDEGRIAGVDTEAGPVETETAVLAAGMWTRHLAARAGVAVPLQACEHVYLVTEPLDEVPSGMPTVRDPGNHSYFKEETGKIMVGFFEPRGKVWRLDGVPRDFAFGTLPEDWDHVAPVFERAVHRMPALSEAGLQLHLNGPESFTPDGGYHLGEAPEVDGCWVAAGFNSIGIQSAGGVGWALAQWIVDGHPPLDLTAQDIRRAFPFQAEPGYLDARIPESLGLLYAMHWPKRHYETARDVKRSPFHGRLEAAGAVFGEAGGWERPIWYAEPGEGRAVRYSWGRPGWFEATGRECRAVREAVGLFDQTSLAPCEVSGPDALAVLQHLGANDVDVDPGRVVYTQWLNGRGGIEADLTVTRLAADRFLVVTSPASATRDRALLRRSAQGRAVTITDLDGGLAVLGIMGPRSRALLQPLVDLDLTDEGFAFGQARKVSVAGVEVLALRTTYVGELGWELYVPLDRGRDADARSLLDAVLAAGPEHGLRPAGYHAMDSLRLEAGYRHWGHDLTDRDTPLEAGLGFAVAWDKPGGFRGRQALLPFRGRTPTRRLVQFRLDDPDRLAHHDEPIRRDGRLVGRVTSGAWSYTESRGLAMGYVERPDDDPDRDEGVTAEWLAAGALTIEVATEPVPVTGSVRPFHDPHRRRVRG